MFRKKNSTLLLNSISECAVEGSNKFESSHSTADTCTSTVSSDCSIPHIASSPAISSQESKESHVQSNNKAPTIRNVSFHSVEIREYEITLVAH